MEISRVVEAAALSFIPIAGLERQSAAARPGHGDRDGRRAVADAVQPRLRGPTRVLVEKLGVATAICVSLVKK